MKFYHAPSWDEPLSTEPLEVLKRVETYWAKCSNGQTYAVGSLIPESQVEAFKLALAKRKELKAALDVQEKDFYKILNEIARSGVRNF